MHYIIDQLCHRSGEGWWGNHS